MKASLGKTIGAFVLVAFAGESYAAREAAVSVKTDGLPTHVAARVQEKAAEGMTALRRYVWITRGMHALDLRALVADEATR
jgi:hypothetical protein